MSKIFFNFILLKIKKFIELINQSSQVLPLVIPTLPTVYYLFVFSFLVTLVFFVLNLSNFYLESFLNLFCFGFYLVSLSSSSNSFNLLNLSSSNFFFYSKSSSLLIHLLKSFPDYLGG